MKKIIEFIRDIYCTETWSDKKELILVHVEISLLICMIVFGVIGEIGLMTATFFIMMITVWYY